MPVRSDRCPHSGRREPWSASGKSDPISGNLISSKSIWHVVEMVYLGASNGLDKRRKGVVGLRARKFQV